MKKNYKKGARFCPKVHNKQADVVQEVETPQIPKDNTQIISKEEIHEPIVEVADSVQQKVIEVAKPAEVKQATAAHNESAQKKDQKKQKE